MNFEVVIITYNFADTIVVPECAPVFALDCRPNCWPDCVLDVWSDVVPGCWPDSCPDVCAGLCAGFVAGCLTDMFRQKSKAASDAGLSARCLPAVCQLLQLSARDNGCRSLRSCAQ